MDYILTNKKGFKISVPEQIKAKFITAGEYSEADFVEDVVISSQESSLEELRVKYKDVYGKSVPPNKSKDISWITTKIGEFVPVEEVAPVVETVAEEAVETTIETVEEVAPVTE